MVTPKPPGFKLRRKNTRYVALATACNFINLGYCLSMDSFFMPGDLSCSVMASPKDGLLRIGFLVVEGFSSLVVLGGSVNLDLS